MRSLNSAEISAAELPFLACPNKMQLVIANMIVRIVFFIFFEFYIVKLNYLNKDFKRLMIDFLEEGLCTEK
jgi:hypothetical protein